MHAPLESNTIACVVEEGATGQLAKHRPALIQHGWPIRAARFNAEPPATVPH